ncbi:hypothetical protein KGM_208280 [Danaus plexippus plexippus]|uniref:FLYWCH-type domain-containing protein n=1 Tax=Danaus plexippus plexippus TaxID=278856 RepID=A0A212EXN7_DANPL|nr:hypothetical protein KGM_208280 [Danaus plexippus plexippus]
MMEKYGKFELRSDAIEFIPSNRSNGRLLVHREYTYVSMNTKTRWYCSKKKMGCKTKLVITPEGEFVELLGQHDHPPPLLYRTQDGQIIKLN